MPTPSFLASYSFCINIHTHTSALIFKVKRKIVTLVSFYFMSKGHTKPHHTKLLKDKHAPNLLSVTALSKGSYVLIYCPTDSLLGQNREMTMVLSFQRWQTSFTILQEEMPVHTAGAPQTVKITSPKEF